MQKAAWKNILKSAQSDIIRESEGPEVASFRVPPLNPWPPKILQEVPAPLTGIMPAQARRVRCSEMQGRAQRRLPVPIASQNSAGHQWIHSLDLLTRSHFPLSD